MIELLSLSLAALLLAVLVVWLGIVALATPTVVYRFDRRFDLDSPEFAGAIASALAAPMTAGNRITRFDDGPSFYPEMLAAIAAARRSIALECYIFHPGRIGEAFAAALADRARAGVQVRMRSAAGGWDAARCAA
jgi:cardiolipin synthase